MNRVAWDLGTQPPVPWHRTGQWNRGPASGPMVIPGTYTVRLEAGANVSTQTVAVLPDPRAHWSQKDYERRYSFLKALNDELSAIDGALNELDALRAHSSGTRRKSIERVYAQFTSGVINSEDDMWSPDRLRERLTILQSTLALSQGPPLPPHLREAAAVHLEYERAMAAYQQFLTQSATTAREGKK